MTNLIYVYKSGKGIYGQEYTVEFVRNGTVVQRQVVFGNDLRYIRQAYTTDFTNARIIRRY